MCSAAILQLYCVSVLGEDQNGNPTSRVWIDAGPAVIINVTDRKCEKGGNIAIKVIQYTVDFKWRETICRSFAMGEFSETVSTLALKWWSTSFWFCFKN